MVAASVERGSTSKKRGNVLQDARTGDSPVYGAVDLGTNNCRMLMATPASQGFRVVGSYSRIVRLGEGLAGGDRLSPLAIGRAIAALRTCAERLASWHPRRVRCVATEACRRAANSAEFLADVVSETGLQLEPIATREEAELTVAGCAPLLDMTHPTSLVFDIGGGSTEVIWLQHDGTNPPRLIDFVSAPIGVVTLAEQIGSGANSIRDYDEPIEALDELLEDFDSRHNIRREVEAGRVGIVGTSGTVTTLGAFDLDLPRYNRAKVNGHVIGRDRVIELNARLAAMGHAARAAHPCIGRNRADLVVAGCAILEAICRRWPVGALRVADQGIREGLIFGMMAADGYRPTAQMDGPLPASLPA